MVALFQPHIKSLLVIMLMPMLLPLNLLSHLRLMGREGGFKLEETMKDIVKSVFEMERFYLFMLFCRYF